MNSVSEQLVRAPQFRVFALVDPYSHEPLASRAGVSLREGYVASLLEQLKKSGHKPENITVDNGSEVTSKELDT